jgi:DNA topoisomerase I
MPAPHSAVGRTARRGARNRAAARPQADAPSRAKPGAATGRRELPADVAVAIRDSGLRYVDDTSPGIGRRRAGRAFQYVAPSRRRLSDEATLDRIRRLAIPPAWKEVWICPRANGHIQATGRDARGRKQYRYHEDWRTTRDATKYERMVAFGHALPRIRARVARDLKRPGLPRAKAIAAMVQLLQRTLIRVGNEEYAKRNGSFGLSTLRDEHVKIARGKLEFRFVGKSGKRHAIDLQDERLARIVGQHLFQYVDREGRRQKITSGDVNDYIREAAGAEYTAKDFRTWSGTVLAALYLAACTGAGGKATKRNLSDAVKNVSGLLGNTPAVCRKAYIHPAIMDGFMRGEVVEAAQRRPGAVPVAGTGLSAEEQAVLSFLERKSQQPRRNLRELLRDSLKRQRLPAPRETHTRNVHDARNRLS